MRYKQNVTLDEKLTSDYKVKIPSITLVLVSYIVFIFYKLVEQKKYGKKK